MEGSERFGVMRICKLCGSLVNKACGRSFEKYLRSYYELNVAYILREIIYTLKGV